MAQALVTYRKIPGLKPEVPAPADSRTTTAVRVYPDHSNSLERPASHHENTAF